LDKPSKYTIAPIGLLLLTMKSTVFCILVLALITFSSAQCPHKDTRSDADVEALVEAINRESFVEGKLKVLETKISESPKSLKSSHVISLIKAFPYIDARNKAMKIMDDYILGFTCAEVRDVLKNLPFENERLVFLESLRFTLTDIANKNLILDAFTFSSNKEKAAELLKDVKQRNCIFGTIKEYELHRVLTFIEKFALLLSMFLVVWMQNSQ
jgi:hypothetical protein